jgi:anti-sigma B factor antagonist
VELTIDTAQEEDGVSVRLSGELDMLAAPQLSDTLSELLDAGHKHIVVDLTDLVFVDSSGLSALLGAHQDAQTRGATLVLQSPNERIVRLVNITGLGDVFEVSVAPEGEPTSSR